MPVGERSEQTRWLPVEGAFNFRDVGGYATGSGGQVQSGLVFRSDALHHLSAEGVRFVESLGVDRIIDLRSPGEIASIGRGAIGDGPFEYLTASVLPVTGGEIVGAPPGDDIAERYMWYLDVGREAFAATFEVLSDPRGGGVVFHCTAGKDRTGVVAALLLAVLGVSADDIAADYALTERALSSIFERLARDPQYAVAMANIPAARRVVTSDTMARFLELLDQKHGGARTWLETAGVAPTSIDALCKRLRKPA